MRTFCPPSMASNASIRTSSSSSSTSLSRRMPPGRGLVEGTSAGRGPCGGTGLIVSRDEAEPASRIPCRGGGAACGGRAGAAMGCPLAGTFAFAVAREPLTFGFGAVTRELTLVARLGLGAVFCALTLARGAWVRARTDFFDGFIGFLEELTPELPDPAHRIGEALQGHHRRSRSELLAWRRGGLRHALGVDADHTVVNPTLLHDQGADTGVALQPPGAGDLEPVHGDDVPADEPGHGDARAVDVGLHVGLWPDEQVAVALDVAAEVPEHLAPALDLKLSRKRVFAGEHRRLRLDTQRVGPAIGTGKSRLNRHVGHHTPPIAPNL